MSFGLFNKQKLFALFWRKKGSAIQQFHIQTPKEQPHRSHSHPRGTRHKKHTSHKRRNSRHTHRNTQGMPITLTQSWNRSPRKHHWTPTSSTTFRSEPFPCSPPLFSHFCFLLVCLPPSTLFISAFTPSTFSRSQLLRKFSSFLALLSPQFIAIFFW